MLRLWAPVPEAAVDKDGDTFAAKYEIGFPIEKLPSAPASDSERAKKRDQSQFSVTIASGADARHDGGTFLRREHVSAHEPNNARKKPRFGRSGVPTSKARSKIRLPSSQEVSGSKAQP